MRKHTILALVFLFLMTFAASAEDATVISGIPKNPKEIPASPAFQIKAYRMKQNPELAIIITSALASHLDRVGNGQVLHIDENYIERFMGTVDEADSDMTMFDEHIVFSYRVEGSLIGKFTLKLEFEPFYRYVNNQTDYSSRINCAYEIGNETYVFNNPGSASGFSISRDESNQKQIAKHRVPLDDDVSFGSLSRTWDVSGNGVQVPGWSVRGAIALDIGPTTYNAETTPYGTYRSQVKLTLTTGV